MEQGQSRRDAFEQGMRAHGYVIGKNLVVEYRWADGKVDRLPELAADLVRSNVDVIVTGVNPSVRCEAGHIDNSNRDDFR